MAWMAEDSWQADGSGAGQAALPHCETCHHILLTGPTLQARNRLIALKAAKAAAAIQEFEDAAGASDVEVGEASEHGGRRAFQYLAQLQSLRHIETASVEGILEELELSPRRSRDGREGPFSSGRPSPTPRSPPWRRSRDGSRHGGSTFSSEQGGSRGGGAARVASPGGSMHGAFFWRKAQPQSPKQDQPSSPDKPSSPSAGR